MPRDLLKLVDRIRKKSQFLDDPIRSRITTDRCPWNKGVGWHVIELTTNVVVVIAVDTMYNGSIDVVQRARCVIEIMGMFSMFRSIDVPDFGSWVL